MREELGERGAWALVGVLFLLVAINLPELGSDPRAFRPGTIDPQGPLAPLVRAAGELPGCLVDEHVVAAGCAERIVLCFGVLVAGGDPSVANSHGLDCIANPRERDVAAYTAFVTTFPASTAPVSGVSRERSFS